MNVNSVLVHTKVMAIFLSVLFFVTFFLILVVSLNYKLRLSLSLEGFEVRLFGILIYHKKDQKFYDFLVKNIDKVKKTKGDSKLIKALLKGIKLDELEFYNGAKQATPLYALTLGFLDIFSNYLRYLSYKHALYIRYVQKEGIGLKIAFSVRPLELIYRYMRYKRIRKKHETSKRQA